MSRGVAITVVKTIGAIASPPKNGQATQTAVKSSLGARDDIVERIRKVQGDFLKDPAYEGGSARR